MLFLIQKEFKQIFRNRFLPRLILLFPIMIICVMPWAANMQIKNVNLAIVDFDKSSTTQKLAMKIAASSYFNIALQTTNTKEAYECIYQNDCDLILELPSNFEQSLNKENKANLGIYANSINSVKGVLGANYLSNIILDFVKVKQLNTLQNSAFFAFETNSIYRFNANLDYKIFMIPALMVMVLTLICGFLPAFNIVAEKEKGISEQINVTPISKLVFILSKLIPYWLIGLLVLSLCFLMAFVIYGLYPKGSFLLVYLFAFIYILVVAGMGIIISNYSNTMQQAMFVSYFFILILILLSGLFTSVKSMPDWAKFLTYLNPLRYFIESLRLIFLKASELSDLWLNLICLLAFAFVLNLWAIFSYKKRG
ncbi:ABC transporter permease [Campylobacter sp. MIT 99-7217]|uniref:ABC transporter permease n=1 Tax=Campylobacter sp. MIT 99-7217 TaxID=535091 RepID=UPI00115A9A30|nr:ABC transporter permease [Campylobacter sp. MIT 99-7217]TQR31824.1 ABC transporter permease [Campylobacter sp. MIT 99-7217]